MNASLRTLIDAAARVAIVSTPALVIGTMFAAIATTVWLLRPLHGSARAAAPVVLIGARAASGTAPSTLLESTMFGFDSSTLNAEGRRVVGDLARRARADGASPVVVIGHADRQGPVSYNDRLSQTRAQAVRDELARHGIDDLRIVAGGVGSRLPITAARDCEGKAAAELVECLRRDRRVEVWLPNPSPVAASSTSASASVPAAR
jgi:outer membrane protein OmpA-like peptidoglycan-associated protein